MDAWNVVLEYVEPQRVGTAITVGGTPDVIEATEYGDVLPLTGAKYRVGSVTSDNVKASALMQDNTWSAVIRRAWRPGAGTGW